MTNKAAKENKGKSGTPTTDSHLIGPRQEYRRTGRAPDPSDAGTAGPEHGKPSTPKPW